MNSQDRNAVYILTNVSNTVFYIGVTSNFDQRIWQHQTGIIDGFTKKYNIKKLVYIEFYKYIAEAIIREKQFKNWHREWKLNLIRKTNPKFEDLYVKNYM